MSFAFSQIQPETTGNVEQLAVPLNHYLEAQFEQGKHDSIFANIWRSSELYQEEQDTDYPMLSPEERDIIDRSVQGGPSARPTGIRHLPEPPAE